MKKAMLLSAAVLATLLFASAAMAQNINPYGDLCANALPGTVACSAYAGQVANTVNGNSLFGIGQLSNAGAILSIAIPAIIVLVIALAIVGKVFGWFK